MNILLLTIAFVFGGLAVFCVMKIREHALKMQREKQDLIQRVTDLEEQAKGKQMPFKFRRWLEDKAAIGDMQDGDMATMALYHQQMGNLLDGMIKTNEQNNALVRAIRSGDYDSDKPTK